MGQLKKSVGREQPFREDLSMEAEESPLSEVVTREQLMKTQQAGKDLACAVVISSDGGIITCSYVSCCKVVNTFNIQSKTPSKVTPMHDSIYYYNNDCIAPFSTPLWPY
jgi:hypothetical protein